VLTLQEPLAQINCGRKAIWYFSSRRRDSGDSTALVLRMAGFKPAFPKPESGHLVTASPLSGRLWNRTMHTRGNVFYRGRAWRFDTDNISQLSPMHQFGKQNKSRCTSRGGRKYRTGWELWALQPKLKLLKISTGVSKTPESGHGFVKRKAADNAPQEP
jgi:hypothetical protein